MTYELANDGDWIRSTLGGRSVLVQRFRDKLAVFENICSHRFYPLKTEKRGNGALRCALHGWMFNHKGENIGVPMCQEYFGKTVKEIQRPLKPIEIQVCGSLVFGRLPAEEGDDVYRPSLTEYLGDMAVVVERVTEGISPFGGFEMTIAANWKLCYHMTLEDYHVATAHPKTFSPNGPLKLGIYRYFFSGLHSAMFVNGNGVRENAFDWFHNECAQGNLPEQYCVFQIFPNILISMTREGVVFVGLYTPTSSGETYHQAWASQKVRSGQSLFDQEKSKGIANFTFVTAEEDRVASEGLQKCISSMWDRPLLGRQEERLAYFDSVYEKFMTDNM